MAGGEVTFAWHTFCNLDNNQVFHFLFALVFEMQCDHHQHAWTRSTSEIFPFASCKHHKQYFRKYCAVLAWVSKSASIELKMSPRRCWIACELLRPKSGKVQTATRNYHHWANNENSAENAHLNFCNSFEFCFTKKTSGQFTIVKYIQRLKICGSRSWK